MTSTVEPTVELPAGFDPTDPDVMQAGVPHQELLTLRRTAPVSFIEQPPRRRAAGFPDHPGYWALSKHADVAAVSKDSTNFSAFQDGVIIRFDPEMDREGVEQTRFLLINHDAPDHTKLRQIVSRAFTPRAIAQLHEDLERRPRDREGRRSSGARATSSRTSRPSCRSRRSPTCSASPWRTAASSSSGRTR